MIKYYLFVTLYLIVFNLFSQKFISFRNTLNEGNFWFYEGNIDSALSYYNQAQQFNLRFFPEELHLYSRCLWEVGQKKKAIKVLKPYGIREFFISDTTYYKGLTIKEREKISSKFRYTIEDLLCSDISFYDTLAKKDQMYRKILINYHKDSKQYDSIFQLMIYQDSLNFISLINQIRKNGYPGGYKMAPIGPRAVLLHAKKEWIQNHYAILMSEIENGRMSFYDFSQAIDRIFTNDESSKPYNSYFPEEKNLSPELVFINRCLIGMSPYYDVYIPRIYPKGKTPQKSMLYGYYKEKKENFNCVRIK